MCLYPQDGKRAPADGVPQHLPPGYPPHRNFMMPQQLHHLLELNLGGIRGEDHQGEIPGEHTPPHRLNPRYDST
jgi:hypothetical protein